MQIDRRLVGFGLFLITVGAVTVVVRQGLPVRSATNVLALQSEIERLESMIADRRELYNDQVYRYDTRIGQVPGVWLAGLFGWTARPFFDAAPEADRVPSARLDDEAGPA